VHSSGNPKIPTSPERWTRRYHADERDRLVGRFTLAVERSWRVADGTRIPVRRQAVTLAALVAALAGCSFGSDSGDAEFIKEADAICAQHERQISLIPPPQTFLRDFAVFMQRAVPIAREQTGSSARSDAGGRRRGFSADDQTDGPASTSGNRKGRRH
jgi:hypothetical protein